jgi:hypothetical protein
MGYGHANCQKCGRPTFVYPEVGEDESWVICDRCIEDGVAVDWPGYAGRLEAELAALKTERDSLSDDLLLALTRNEALLAELAALKAAGDALFKWHVSLVESGDAGFWDWREDEECKAWLAAREEG